MVISASSDVSFIMASRDIINGTYVEVGNDLDSKDVADVSLDTVLEQSGYYDVSLLAEDEQSIDHGWGYCEVDGFGSEFPESNPFFRVYYQEIREDTDNCLEAVGDEENLLSRKVILFRIQFSFICIHFKYKPLFL